MRPNTIADAASANARARAGPRRPSPARRETTADSALASASSPSSSSASAARVDARADDETRRVLPSNRATRDVAAADGARERATVHAIRSRSIMPRRRRLAVMATLVVALSACMSVGARAGKNVRPRSRGGFAGGAARARPGRSSVPRPPRDAFGAKRGRAAPRTAVENELERRRRMLMAQTDAAVDRGRAEALREKRREHFAKEESSRRRRRLTEDSEGSYAPIDADEKFEGWNAVEEVPASSLCDGCKLTVRGVHADAAASARTTPQSSWKALDESLREELVELVWRERTCARFKNVTALRRDRRDRLVDVREDTRHSEITNPTEARRRPEENPDVYAAEMLAGVCELLREDVQTKDLLAGALAALNDVRPMTDARARAICNKITADAECTANGRDEL